MPATILAARDYDPCKARRRWQWIIGILCAAIITGEHIGRPRQVRESQSLSRIKTEER
jgi:hypothetical protein